MTLPVESLRADRPVRPVGRRDPGASLLTVPEVRLGLGCAGLFATTAVCVGTHAPLEVMALLLLVQCGASSALLRGPVAGALLVGATGWALCTGFGVNELGELTFREPDVRRLVAYTLVALTCRWLGRHNGRVRVEEARCGEARSAHSVVPGGTGSRWSPPC